MLGKRNLKEYGGLLDEVIWSVNTDKEDDLAYLEELVASNSRYRKHEATKEYEWYIGNKHISLSPFLSFLFYWAAPNFSSRLTPGSFSLEEI
jgi:hypothetical protein